MSTASNGSSVSSTNDSFVSLSSAYFRFRSAAHYVSHSNTDTLIHRLLNQYSFAVVEQVKRLCGCTAE